MRRLLDVGTTFDRRSEALLAFFRTDGGFRV